MRTDRRTNTHYTAVMFVSVSDVPGGDFDDLFNFDADEQASGSGTQASGGFGFDFSFHSDTPDGGDDDEPLF